MIFSKRTYQILIVAALLFALSPWLAFAKEMAVAIDLILVLLIVADYLLTAKTNVITAHRMVSERLSIGRANAATIRVYNAGASALKCRLKDDYPQLIDCDGREFEFTLPARGFSQLDYALTPKRRGLYKFGRINCRYLSFLQLFWRQVKLKEDKEVKVYSDLKALYDLSIKLSHSSELGELHQRRRGQGTDFSSLREYTVGDDAKSIDWKATARQDRPVVRTYEAEQDQRLLILLDAGRMMVSDLEGLTRYDHALNAALCLALTGLSHNDQVGLGIFADRPLAYLPPHRGKSYLKKILDVSFDLEPMMVEPDYVGVLSYFAAAQKGRCLMVVLTDLTDPTGSQALLTGLASLSNRHLPFCVTLTDRQVIKIANQTIDPSLTDKNGGHSGKQIDSIYQRAIATDLLAQRELALSVLQRRGCLVLDAPPQELSDKLVDSYLEIKMSARL